MGGPSISANLRIERRLAPDNTAAQRLDHRCDDVIGTEAQPILQHLQRQVTVAEMPGDAQQIGRAVGGDLDDRLGRGAHPEIAAIVELEPVAFREMLGPRQIQQERRPGIRDQADAPAVPVEKRQGHAVDRGLLRPLAARMHRYRPPHKFTTENFTMTR